MARPRRRWLPAPELLEYCTKHLHMPVEDARTELYWAVTDGHFRAWRNGKVLSLEEARALRDPRPVTVVRRELGRGEVALPDDILVRVEDAERAWGRHYRRRWAWDHPPKMPAVGGGPSRPRSGRKPEKRELTKAAMRSDLQEKRLTRAELEGMTEVGLAARYRVNRETVRKAREAVLSEL